MSAKPPTTPSTSLLLAALLLSGLLAGCQDRGPTEIEVAPGQVVSVSEAPKPSKGIVSGIVGDDAVYPLPDATIYILGLGLNTTSDKNGRFALVDVPPGIYILEGSKKDHASVQTTVDVQAGEVARAVLLLPRVPSTDPYHLTVQQEAYIGAAALFVLDSSNTTLDFYLDESKPRTLVLESAWQGTVVATRSEAFGFQLLGGAEGREVVAGAAGNPFSLHVDARILPPGVRSYGFTFEPQPDATVLQGTGRLFATVFYNEPAPPGWSLLAGDA